MIKGSKNGDGRYEFEVEFRRPDGSLYHAGDTLVVAAKSEDSSATGIDGNPDDNGAPESGAVYVFRNSGTAAASLCDLIAAAYAARR